MSKCPFAVEAMDALGGALKEVGSRVNLQVDYLVQESSGEFSAPHGEAELKGNIVQLCAHAHYSQAQYLSFIACQNQTWRWIPKGWQHCAEKSSMDQPRLQACLHGAEGRRLLGHSRRRTEAAQAQTSPTIKIAGALYQGQRTKPDLLRAICQKLPPPHPAGCRKILDGNRLRAIVLSDRRCAACRTESLMHNLKYRLFPHLTIKTLDYAQPEGKQLYHSLKLKHLPVVLFEPGSERENNYLAIKPWLVPLGPYQQLKIPASFIPTP
jgi:hypothetical protein